MANSNYRKKTHPQFKTDTGYQPYAQFGATKIEDNKAFVRAFMAAPRLDERAQDISCPTKFIYGGEDHLNGIWEGRLPKHLSDMHQKVRKHRVGIILGADHSLNRKTRIDDCWNQDRQYASVTRMVHEHFCEQML